ncbi:MAG TPA: nucleotidyl transferase AbiEii/AbiGii toxin family protein [Gammaproteobacteria bacterium]|jgi:predicted nucleotidyltransferase component of viral defense system|nr:nucleotidyl transferase AbiEii/AbiGii toxin family protein [Gammaproteobacteria bacterium]
MIPEIFIQEWRKNVAWQTPAQIEQDLIISRALIDLYSDPHVSETLVFRGGTALNKLFLKPPSRYSEDIDFVQKNPSPIGQTINAIRELFKPWLGDPKWKITERSAKLIYKYESFNNMPAKLKIEINTTEHFQALPLKTVPFTVASDWFNGAANIVTYELDELMATKLRALYQRRKGRDLFDLWLTAKNNLVNTDRVFEIFKKYCISDDYHFSRDEFLQNLALKRNHEAFRSDMYALLPVGLKWNFDEAYQFVLEHLINRLP